jgi:hypothetical protein
MAGIQKFHEDSAFHSSCQHSPGPFHLWLSTAKTFKKKQKKPSYYFFPPILSI